MAATANASPGEREERAQFVPVEVVANSDATGEAAVADARGVIVQLPGAGAGAGGRRIIVERGFDAQLLRQVVAALEALPPEALP